MNVNALCMEEEHKEVGECDGEEVAGAGLMCQAAGQWHLVGVAAWRKGCSQVTQ